MKREQFNNILNELNGDSTDIVKLVLEENDENISNPTFKSENEAHPRDLTLDTVIYVSQELKQGDVKKYEFVVCEAWLKPNNVWTIVNIKKAKEEQNFWILFYDSGTYYLKKGIKGPIGVHVELKHKKEQY